MALAAEAKPKTHTTTHWSPQNEIDFIKGLGRHRQSYTNEKTEREWLELYISVHQDSKLHHHKAGVVYAKERLDNLNAAK